MSLVKNPIVSEQKLAANQLNGSLSHGPVTAEGKARTAVAHWRHGSYAQPQEAALHDLGEDPADFVALLDGLHQEFTPAGPLQERLVGKG